ncbi:MAG: 30S ribosomal protein S20 [Parcubacteria group bacterium Gr01-1014_8]|nr:MAG: 30S ribosomal protein S20 [Parcubacteria group bacterium Gr01-1014_8]
MAITSSAKKAQRSSLKRRVFNARRKKAMKDVVKDVAQLVSKKDLKEIALLLPKVYQNIDKAAKRGVIKANAAARIKSRLSKRIAALS